MRALEELSSRFDEVEVRITPPHDHGTQVVTVRVTAGMETYTDAELFGPVNKHQSLESALEEIKTFFLTRLNKEHAA